MTLSAKRNPSLTRVTIGFIALGAIIAAAGAWFVVSERLTAFRQQALGQAVTVRASGVAFEFARILHHEWQDARTIAQEIALRDRSAIRSSLDLVVGDRSRVPWAGIAALDGTVTHASGGLLEGQNVSSRPWFQRGLEGDFAGDVHEAVLLAKLLPSDSGEPRHFLDLATPIRSADGRITGVLGLHLDYAWARNYLLETAEKLQIEAFVVNRQGEIVIGPGREGEILDLPSMRAASTGSAMTSRELWPHGESYFTTVIPEVGYADLPPFGWSLVARIDDSAFVETSASSRMTIVVFLVGFGLLLAAMTLLFLQIFIVPLRRVADSARAILKGEDVYPYEARSTTEAEIFSAAVSRLEGLQNRGKTRPDT